MRLARAPLFAIVLLAVDAQSSELAAPAAKIECPAVAQPGRVRCDVEVRVSPAREIRWAEVAIVQAPSFASPLRARAGPPDATMREPSSWRWPIALAAKERGAGKVDARVRVVTCAAGSAEACAATTIDVQGDVVVGE